MLKQKKRLTLGTVAVADLSVVRSMKRRLVATLLLSSVAVAMASEMTSEDLVGAWTFGVPAKNYNYYTFWPDQHYTRSQGDTLFEGRWKLVDGKEIIMDSKVTMIDSFNGHTLRVTLPSGREDVWKKMPRWRGSLK